VNGRKNSFDKHFESRKSTLSERLAEYKENKKIKAYDAEVDNLVKQLESEYNELYDIINAKMDIPAI
jgi:molecular chaperone GrpE (heat shock protein)